MPSPDFARHFHSELFAPPGSGARPRRCSGLLPGTCRANGRGPLPRRVRTRRQASDQTTRPRDANDKGPEILSAQGVPLLRGLSAFRRPHSNSDRAESTPQTDLRGWETIGLARACGLRVIPRSDMATLTLTGSTTKPAGVPGGCAGALEPIRGCHRACAPATGLTLRRLHAEPPARERASDTAQTPGAFANTPAWRQRIEVSKPKNLAKTSRQGVCLQ